MHLVKVGGRGESQVLAIRFPQHRQLPLASTAQARVRAGPFMHQQLAYIILYIYKPNSSALTSELKVLRNVV